MGVALHLLWACCAIAIIPTSSPDRALEPCRCSKCPLIISFCARSAAGCAASPLFILRTGHCARGGHFRRMNLSRPPDQQFRYFNLQPRQRFQLVRAYHHAFGSYQLWREWQSNRNWAFAFLILGSCFITLPVTSDLGVGKCLQGSRTL